MRYRYLSALALLSSVAIADPAPSVNLSVGGAITPGVCNVSFDNGGALDFGAYGYHDLSETEWTTLPKKGVRLDVACGRSSTALIDITDNMADPAQQDKTKFSLGFQDEKSVGYYDVTVANVYYDGRSATLVRETAPGNWEPANYLHKDTKHGWAISAIKPPVAFSAARATLNITPKIVPRNELDTAQPLQLAGSLSISLRYL